MVLTPHQPVHRTTLWVVPVGDLAGVARHVLDTVRAGIPGWKLVVLCPPGPLAEAVTQAGGAVLVAPFGPASGLRSSVASLRHTVRTLRPQVVHSHLSYGDIVVGLATPRGVPLVTTEHGIAADDAVYHRSGRQARLMAFVHHLRLRRFDRVIAVSQATRTAMQRKWRPRQEVTVIPNGVDRPAPPIQVPGLHILSLARLAPEKRLDDLVAAFALVAAAQPDAHLTIAGVGPLEPPLRRQVDRLGLADRVAFTGHVDAEQALTEANVVAQLSVWENCSYTLLDALTHGLGVVASPVGGNPEMLPGRCLVDPGDHGAVAQRLITQGRDLTARPASAADWPTTSQMTARVAEIYDGIGPR